MPLPLAVHFLISVVTFSLKLRPDHCLNSIQNAMRSHIARQQQQAGKTIKSDDGLKRDGHTDLKENTFERIRTAIYIFVFVLINKTNNLLVSLSKLSDFP